MNRTPEQRRRARPFLCRHNLWHRWEEKRIRVFASGRIESMWVCKRCKTTIPHFPSNGGTLWRPVLTLIGADEPEVVVPLRSWKR